MTGNERMQGRKIYSLKENVDKALEESSHEVERVFVASRTGKKVSMTPGRDVSLEEVIYYRIAGKFSGEFNLADWRICECTAKLNSANIP